MHRPAVPVPADLGLLQCFLSELLDIENNDRIRERAERGYADCCSKVTIIINNIIQICSPWQQNTFCKILIGERAYCCFQRLVVFVCPTAEEDSGCMTSTQNTTSP